MYKISRCSNAKAGTNPRLSVGQGRQPKILPKFQKKAKTNEIERHFVGWIGGGGGGSRCLQLLKFFAQSTGCDRK